MTYKEPDYETVILLKLGVMEDLLKSFMASLEEIPQKKRGNPPVAQGKRLGERGRKTMYY